MIFFPDDNYWYHAMVFMLWFTIAWKIYFRWFLLNNTITMHENRNNNNDNNNNNNS